MSNRDQVYAARVYERVVGLPEAYRPKYGAMAHKLPVLIRTAGLVQALAFVEARGEDAHHQLLQHLAEVIGANNRATMLNRSRTAGPAEYMRLTQETLSALLWFKRFAQSVLGVVAGEERGGGT